MSRLAFLLLFFSHFSIAQPLYFPPNGSAGWDTLSLQSLGWCSDKMDTLIDYLDSRNTKAFILLKDGKIVKEHYFGTFTADSLWYWASAGKTLTAMAVGIARQEGFLELSDTSSSYLGPGWTACTSLQEEKITIRNQLTMTSGLDDGVADPYCTLDTCLVYLADAGTRWAYHNGPYTLLDSVIEQATGQSLNAYVAQKISLITGVNGLFLPSGYNNVFYSKARSMARFGLLVLNRGVWNGTPVLSDTLYFSEMTNSSQSLNPAYGYLWWLNGKSSFKVPGLQFSFPGYLNPSAPADMIAALGKNGQTINVVPSMNLVYIRMGDAPGSGEVPINFNDSIWSKLNDVFCQTTSAEMYEPEAYKTFFPNPASHSVQISDPYIDQVEVMNVKGQLIFRQTLQQFREPIYLDDLDSGIYLLRMINTKKAESQTSRLVVLH